MARILRLDMTGVEIAADLSEGNVGALTVILEMFKHGAEIDRDSALGGLGSVLALDTHGIYGPRIWMLYKDVCGQDLRVTLAILRAVQLGFLSESDLNYAIDNSRRPGKTVSTIDVPALVAKVEERLPNFQKNPAAASESPMPSHIDYLNSQE